MATKPIAATTLFAPTTPIVPASLPSATTIERSSNPLLETRSDKHSDLSEACSYLHDQIAANQVADCRQLLVISRNVERMIEAATQAERLAAVQSVLSQRQDCGLAYAVLAREGAQNEEEAESYYRKAVPLLKREYQRHADLCENDCLPSEAVEPYFLEEKAYAIVADELARGLWRRGKQAEAIKEILSVISECQADSAIGCSWLAAHWLIQVGDDVKALSLVDGNPVDLAQWYYLKALLLFRFEGDSPVSRSALRIAMDEKVDIGIMILHGDWRLEGEDWSEEYYNDHFFWAGHKAWELSDGALQWLAEELDRRILKFSETHATEDVDSARYKRWRMDFEAAQTFKNRSEFKDARRLLRSALKEAEKMGVPGRPFQQTFVTLSDLYHETEGPLDELEAVLCKHLDAINSVESCLQKKARSLSFLGNCFTTIGSHNLAARVLHTAEELLEGLLKDGDPSVSLYELASVLKRLGSSLGEQCRYEEAEPFLRWSIVLQRLFLGEAHPIQASSLCLLARCLHHLGRHRHEAAVRRQAEQVDGDYVDPHEHCGFACPWYVDGCTGESGIESNSAAANQRRITAGRALRLSMYFGNSPKFWMNLLTHYDLKLWGAI